jgi:hypothetical protein
MRPTLAMLAVAALAAPAFAADAPAGLAEGAKVPAFHPQHVAGPDKGSTACFV